ncbi:MAG: hypothetical protein ACREEP_05825 [Dongiaceae bacterium]
MNQKGAGDRPRKSQRIGHMRFLRRALALNFDVVKPEAQVPRRRLLRKTQELAALATRVLQAHYGVEPPLQLSRPEKIRDGQGCEHTYWGAVA